MSADLLRKAAREMREKGPMTATADLLEQHADLHDTYDCPHGTCAATQMAQSYLANRA